MRVVAKFAVAFFFAAAAVLALYGYLGLRAEVGRIDDNVVVDLSSLGDGLRSAIRATWRDEGEREALEIVSAAQSGRQDVEIRWTSGVPSSVQDSLEQRPDGDEQVVTLSLPVRVDDTRGGTLVLRRRLPGTMTLLRRELVDDVGFAVLLAVVLGALAIGLGLALIGRPLDRIVAQARRIGAGDFSQRLSEDRHDEIGDLKRELNSMCEQLLAAQKRVEDESSARLETLEQLRHLDRLRSVGTMASSMAHELGTPLNVLLLRGQSLAKGEPDPTEVEVAGRTIVGQVEKMSKIVRQMLDFSRTKSLAPERITGRALVERTVDLLSGIARRSGVTLATQVAQDGVIEGHPNELEQALSNLVMNAVQAMSRGGTVTLVVRTGDASTPNGASIARPASVRRKGDFEAVMIDVRDDGPGIASDVLTKVFEPFFTTKGTGEGTGLGLTVASGIAEDHGGFVTATSELGVGSTFTMTLPRTP